MKTKAQVGCISVIEERCPVTAQFTNTVGLHSALEASLFDINGHLIGHAVTVSNDEGVSDVQYYNYKSVETVSEM